MSGITQNTMDIVEKSAGVAKLSDKTMLSSHKLKELTEQFKIV